MEKQTPTAGTVLSRYGGPTRSRLLLLALIPALLVATGTIGYYLLADNYTWFDALYMTVITLSTLGFEELNGPLNPKARVFTLFLVLGGTFTFFFTTLEIIRLIVSGEVQGILGRQRMERNLTHLQNHFIVCGYGRMGRLVCQEFSRLEKPFVIIDSDGDLLAEFDLPRGIPLLGDATVDDVLKHAGIDRAKALVTVMPSDADNLYTTMSARLLNTDVYIVVRVEDPQSEIKLRRAGANRIVSPYQIGGHRLAQAVLRPAVTDFIEIASRGQHLELQMEETKIAAGSPLAGRSLRDSPIRSDLKVIIMAVKKPSGEMIFNPVPDMQIDTGDTLIAVGPREQLDRLEVLANG